MFYRNGLFANKLSSYSKKDITSSIEESYALAKKGYSSESSFSCWKVGGATLQNRKYFSVNCYFFGQLSAEQVFSSNSNLSQLPLNKFQGEAEVIVRVNKTLVSDLLTDTSAIQKLSDDELFEGIGFSIEMPDSSLDDLHGNINALISDRCSTGCVVHSSFISLDEFRNLQFSKFEIFQDNTKISEGQIDVLLQSPFDIARSLFLIANKYDYKIEPGDFISTGGITPCVKFKKGACISLKVDSKEWVRFLV